MGQRKQMQSFIKFVNERHAIYERRQRGDPYPWTRDLLLRKYKFCNVFRHLDRGSQDFLKLAAPGNMDPLHALFRATLWTVFNKKKTWQRLAAAVDLDKWNKPSDIKRKIAPMLYDVVDTLRNKDIAVFTNIYCRPQSWQHHGIPVSKVVINLVTELVSNMDITDKFINAKTLIDAALVLTEIYSIGPFFAWQITINAWWTKAFQFHDDDRALIGRGSLAGLRLLDGGKDKHRIFAQALHACKKHGPQHGAMRAIDVEHALCEWNKYVNLQEQIRCGKKIRTDRLYKSPEWIQIDGA